MKRRVTVTKRQREQAKREKQERKAARRANRSLEPDVETSAPAPQADDAP